MVSKKIHNSGGLAPDGYPYLLDFASSELNLAENVKIAAEELIKTAEEFSSEPFSNGDVSIHSLNNKYSELKDRRKQLKAAVDALYDNKIGIYMEETQGEFVMM